MDELDLAKRRSTLISRYPYMFAGGLVGFQKDPRDEQLEYAIRIEPGWFDIVEKLCADIDALLPGEVKRLDGRGFHIRQIKQKFGTLRFYWDIDIGPSPPVRVDFVFRGGGFASLQSGDKDDAPVWHEGVRALISAAEQRSSRTCFECGAPGRLRRDRLGWLQASCDAHAGSDTSPASPG